MAVLGQIICRRVGIAGFSASWVSITPACTQFFEELKKEQADTESMLRQLDVGQRIRRGTERRRREMEEQMKTIVSRYDDYVRRDDVFSYLKNVGYQIKF